MGSITSIDARRRFDQMPLIAPSVADDPLDVIDDHTRRLLARSPASRRSRLVPRVLAGTDVLCLTVSYLIATFLSGPRGTPGSLQELGLFLASLPCWTLLASLQGLYHRDDERADHCTTDDLVGVFYLVTVGAWLLLVVSHLIGRSGPGILEVTAFWILAVLLLPAGRTVARRFCRRTVAYQQNTVVVGAGEIGQLIARKLVKHPEYGANVVGFVDRAPRERRRDLPEHLTILGGPERLPEIIERLDVERVVVAFSTERVRDLLALLRQVRALGVQIDLVPWLFELVGPRVSVHAVEGLPLVGLPPQRHSRASLALKRGIDVVGAAAGLLAFFPLMVFIALWIRSDSPGPVLFRQTRLGQNMTDFTALKFRTMKTDADTTVHRDYIRRSMSAQAESETNGLYKLDRSDAITRVGRWLRKTSLDELPQLINVLMGDMSLVGPRPCIPYETENFEPHHFDRFLMPQGITGLWQVTARANATYAEALDFDVAYVRGWTLGLDLRLILRTPLQMLRQRGATT
jgi:exopolysaccharide biosynthesis polyprenyl glycosylphosphotransferase